MNTPRLAKELATHKANFTATIDKAVKPVQARQQELIRTRTEPLEGGARFKTAADFAQCKALVQEENADYEKVRAAFFWAEMSVRNRAGQLQRACGEGLDRG